MNMTYPSQKRRIEAVAFGSTRFFGAALTALVALFAAGPAAGAGLSEGQTAGVRVGPAGRAGPSGPLAGAHPSSASPARRAGPTRVWIGDAEHFPQYAQPDDISCGPTCCCMLLGYYGVEADVEALKASARTRWFTFGGEEIGLTFPRSIGRALEDYGVPVGVYRGTLDHVREFVDENRPPILLVRSGPWTWHYIVVIGYGEQEGEPAFYYVDPGSGRTHWATEADIDCGWCFDGDYGGREITGPPCTACEGSGEIGLGEDADGDGQEDRGACPTCDGAGHLPDWARWSVEWFVSRRTLIVPDEPGREIGE